MMEKYYLPTELISHTECYSHVITTLCMPHDDIWLMIFHVQIQEEYGLSFKFHQGGCYTIRYNMEYLTAGTICINVL